MKVILISVLLFFDICTGIPLQKIKDSQPTHVPVNLTDVYEIEEGDRKTIRFVYPKSEIPTLREITYFHIKETPYIDIGDIEGSGSEDLDVIVTLRPFTNNHGFQFLDEDTEKNYETKDMVIGETEDSTGEGQLGSGEELPPIGEDEEYADAMEEVVETETLTEKAATAKDTNIPLPDVPTTTKTVAKSATTETVITTSTEEPNALLNSISPVNEEKPSQKYKREISPDDLPPAPTLPPLDLSILPDDVKMVISSAPTPANTTQKQEEPNVFNEDRLKEALGHKIEDIITLLSPNRDQDVNEDDIYDGNDANDSDDDDVETDNEDGSDESWDDEVHGEDEDTKVRKPRTYGMNLSNGRGYVWNDLVSDPGMPGMSFDVGEPEHNLSNNKPDIEPLEDKKPESTDKPIIKEPTSITPVHNVHFSTESRPIYMSGNNNETDKKEDKPKPNEESSDNTDLEDIEVTRNKLRLLPNDSSENKEKHVIDDFKLKSKAPNEKELDIKKKHNEVQKKNHKKELQKPENDDFVKELMKNEKFWKWLSDWTATYLELLMKHIKDVVEDEVASQMKTLVSKIKKELEKEASSDKAEVVGNPVNDKKPEMPKDSNKISFDGKEIPITHTSNFDSPVEKKSLNKIKEEHKKVNKENNKASKHKGENDRKKEHATNGLNKDSKHGASTSIRAQSIFGNVVGSDNVTNIFVFYPDSDNDDVIKENIKPLINGADNVFTFYSGDKVDNDKRHPQITGQKDESTMTENKPQNGSIITPDIGTSKPTDKPNQDIQESETKNKEHIEPTTTPKSDSDKSETASDKKELDHALPAKQESETKNKEHTEPTTTPKTDSDKSETPSDKKELDHKLPAKQESETKNKEHTEPTTTPKVGKSETASDKKELDHTLLAKEDETKPENPNAAQNDTHKDTFESKETSLDNKEKEGKDSQNADRIKTDDTNDNKDKEATEPNKSIAETTKDSPSSIIGKDKDKKPENHDEKTSVKDDKTKELDKESSKVDDNSNKELTSDSEKKDDKTNLQA